MNKRLINANDLILRIGASCLNDEISIEEAKHFKDIVEQTPTVEVADVNMSGKKGFGKNLKKICAENGISIVEISKGADVPVQTLYAQTKRESTRASYKTETKVFNYLKTRIPGLTMEELFSTEKEAEQ